MKTQNLQKNPT